MAHQTYSYEYTDTFAGEANYTWCKRGTVIVPDLAAYGYDGWHGYEKANKRRNRVIVRKVKAALGLTNVRCEREDVCETIVLRPRGSATVVFIDYRED